MAYFAHCSTRSAGGAATPRMVAISTVGEKLLSPSLLWAQSRNAYVARAARPLTVVLRYDSSSRLRGPSVVEDAFPAASVASVHLS